MTQQFGNPPESIRSQRSERNSHLCRPPLIARHPVVRMPKCGEVTQAVRLCRGHYPAVVVIADGLACPAPQQPWPRTLQKTAERTGQA